VFPGLRVRRCRIVWLDSLFLHDYACANADSDPDPCANADADPDAYANGDAAAQYDLEPHRRQF
jgi:hypothetical protein